MPGGIPHTDHYYYRPVMTETSVSYNFANRATREKRAKIIEIVRDNPGITGAEIICRYHGNAPTASQKRTRHLLQGLCADRRLIYLAGDRYVVPGADVAARGKNQDVAARGKNQDVAATVWSQTVGKNQELSATVSNQVTCRLIPRRLGWQLTFPDDPAAGLVFFTRSELMDFVNSCGHQLTATSDLESIGECPTYWLDRARIFYPPF